MDANSEEILTIREFTSRVTPWHRLHSRPFAFIRGPPLSFLISSDAPYLDPEFICHVLIPVTD
jgi:hypothetical protein